VKDKDRELPPVYERKRYKKRLPEKYQLQERRRKGILLRMAGASNTEIGLQLHADPSVNATGESFPGGYGWRTFTEGRPPLVGRGLAEAVSKDLRGELDRGESKLDDLREEFRELELLRLDHIQKGIWQRASSGNDWAIDRFLGIVDRRMKLLGLEAPARTHAELRQTITVAQGVLPDVDPAFATAILEGLEELASAPARTLPSGEGTRLESDVIDAEVVEVVADDAS
jgi:hypothetical protein